jgi:tetratricopeptide (TPR) repeat protein
MRQLTTLIILILLISCQSKTESDQNLDNYNQGLKILETIDSNGEIDYKKAYGFFELSLLDNPNHIESKFWKMQCELKEGNLDNALKTSRIAITDSKNKNHKLIPHFYVSAGLVEKINGNSDKSMDYFSSAIEIYNSRIKKNINDTDAIMNKTVILCYMDKKDKAISFLDSISLNEEKQTLLEQIRKDILDFDSEKIIYELKGDKN